MVVNEEIVFLASLWKVTRDNENATKVVLECDAGQLDQINEIPAQTLLRVKIETE